MNLIEQDERDEIKEIIEECTETDFDKLFDEIDELKTRVKELEGQKLCQCSNE